MILIVKIDARSLPDNSRENKRPIKKVDIVLDFRKEHVIGQLANTSMK